MDKQTAIYRQSYRLRNIDVDVYRRLRWDTLFSMLQEAAITHAEQLGCGREQTLDRGFLWVIALQQVEITRLPLYEETVTLTTWPGRTMHVFFPRYFRMTDELGGLLFEGSAFWGLMDQTTRKLVPPKEAGVRAPYFLTGDEPALPRQQKSAEITQTTQFTVPYSYLDLNGHMNNTRYFDLAQDLLPPQAHAQPPKRIIAEYAGEATLGQTLTVGLGETETGWFLEGTSDRRVFRMWID